MMHNQYPYFYKADLANIINQKINEKVIYYCSLYILKKMSLFKEDGGIIFKVISDGPNPYEILDAIFHFLYEQNYIQINAKKQAYELSEEGNVYIEDLILEIESYIDQYQDHSIENRIEIIKADRLDPFRIRFLWGLYDGEFDNLVEWKNKNNHVLWDSSSYNHWPNIITNEKFFISLYYDIFLKKESIERIFFYNLEHPDFKE